jgi:hypothetical protein
VTVETVQVNTCNECGGRRGLFHRCGFKKHRRYCGPPIAIAIPPVLQTFTATVTTSTQTVQLAPAAPVLVSPQVPMAVAVPVAPGKGMPLAQPPVPSKVLPQGQLPYEKPPTSRIGPPPGKIPGPPGV